MTEAMLAGIAILARRYIDGFVLNKVTFQHTAPKDMTVYHQAFNCPLEFNADRNAISANASFLNERKKKLTAQLLAPVVKSYIGHQIKKHPRNQRSISLLAYDAIPTILGIGKSELPHVAEAMQMHPKKLQRLLRDENTSYSDVLEDVRKNMAERLLRDSDISISKIAAMLDYASDRTFAKAARRWFEMSPRQYRKYLRGE